MSWSSGLSHRLDVYLQRSGELPMFQDTPGWRPIRVCKRAVFFPRHSHVEILILPTAHRSQVLICAQCFSDSLPDLPRSGPWISFTFVEVYRLVK